MRIRGFLVAFLAGVMATPLHAQRPDSGAFIMRLGKDTLAVERYVRTPLMLKSEVVYRVPQTRALTLTVTFNEKGAVAWYEVLNNRVAGVPNSAPQTRILSTYVGDSALIQTWVDAVPQPPQMVPLKRGLMPVSVPFYSTIEAAFTKARAAGRDTATVEGASPQGPIAYPFEALQSAQPLMSIPGSGLVAAKFDTHGHMAELNGAKSTFKVDVARISWPDLTPFFTRWAQADAAGKSLGALSPRDQVDTDLSGVSILIDYSRPARRGRTIFGNVVPFGQVWRTGANAATRIVFNGPLLFNGTRVDAGSYTLWTIPDPKSWQLIFNRQVGQWGTEYHAEQDVVRIPVKSETLTTPVDRFTIEIKPTSATEATMTLTWDKTRVVVPIKRVD